MRKQTGFSLIELLIAVAIVAILASIAYPSYLSHIRKARRADAQAALMDIASRQQQYLLDTRGYASSVSTLNVSVPQTVTQTYSITISTATTTVPAFTVTADPTGSQAQDPCGSLSLTHAGAKSPANCW